MTVARWIGLVGGLLLVLGGRAGLAQSSAEAYFHEAARQYVDGNVEAARTTVQRGLEASPSNPRLQALLKALERKRNEQEGGGRSSRAGRRGQGDPQRRPGSTPETGGETQNSRDTQSTSNDARSSDHRGQPPNAEDQSQRQGQREGMQAGVPGPTREESPPRNVLSRAQANRLLQALQIQEKTLLRRLRVRDLDERTVEKDW